MRKHNSLAPRALFRLMPEFGEIALGVIVSKAGLALRLVCGNCRVTLEVGGQAAQAPALPAPA